MKNRIWKYADINTHLSDRDQNELVLVGGCFDLLHYGHITFLKNAKRPDTFLLVALESDEYIVNHKHRKPIHTQEQRAEILIELRSVDAVLLLPYFTSDSEYTQMVATIKPHVIAITEGDGQAENKKKQLEQMGGRIEIVTRLLSDYSTTTITQQI
ncbi:MAG: adenylyltransferase/cytidyltransferase family protein [bacterium]|nr:adenylyltransferase/cytidyltransferase family protein [bacterium]